MLSRSKLNVNLSESEAKNTWAPCDALQKPRLVIYAVLFLYFFMVWDP